MSLKSIALHGLNAASRFSARMPACGRFRPLRGSFSAKRLLDEGEIEGRLISRSQMVGRCPPGSMTEKAAFRQHDHQPWPIFWTRSDQARLVGRMFHWRDSDDRLCSESVYGLLERRRLGEDTLHAQIWLPKAKPIAGAWTTITSNWNDGGNYYHWLLDGLSRLAVRDQLPEATRILLPDSLPRFAKETLALLGLDDQIHMISKPCVQPERYYFCAPTAMTGVWNPFGYQWLRRSFATYSKPPNSGKPVFLTRRGQARVPRNLDEIEKTVLNHGFEIIDCGSISVREQIEIVSASPAIAGLHGAAMTNLLWARPGTPVIEIFEAGYLNGCYEQIAFEGKLDYIQTLNHGAETTRFLNEWCISNSLSTGA